MEQGSENMIEFLKDEKTATLTITQPRFMTMVKKLAAKYPDQVEIVHDRDCNGYFLAHIPVAFIRLQGTLELTEEQRQMKREQVARMRDIASSARASKGSKTVSNYEDEGLYLQGQNDGF